MLPKDLGQLMHLAPEYFKARQQAQDPQFSMATDLWAVGLLLYEISSGKSPYPSVEQMQNDKTQMMKLFQGQIETVPDVDFIIRNLILGLLNMDEEGKIAKDEFIKCEDDQELPSLLENM